MIELTDSFKLSAYLKSLEVTMPFKTPSSTTGMPEILSSLVSLTKSSIDWVE